MTSLLFDQKIIVKFRFIEVSNANHCFDLGHGIIMACLRRQGNVYGKLPAMLGDFRCRFTYVRFTLNFQPISGHRQPQKLSSDKSCPQLSIILALSAAAYGETRWPQTTCRCLLVQARSHVPQ